MTSAVDLGAVEAKAGEWAAPTDSESADALYNPDVWALRSRLDQAGRAVAELVAAVRSRHAEIAELRRGLTSVRDWEDDIGAAPGEDVMREFARAALERADAARDGAT